MTNHQTTVPGQQSLPAVASSGDLDTTWADGKVGYLLRRASAAMATDYAQHAGDDDLRPVLVTMLSMIEANPGTSPSELGDALGIKRTNIVPLVSELVERGLVERRRSETDRRSVELHASVGSVELRRGQRLIEAHESRMTSNLSPAERDQLLVLLTRLATGPRVSDTTT